MEFEVTRPTMFRLILRREAFIARRRAYVNSLLRHGAVPGAVIEIEF